MSHFRLFTVPKNTIPKLSLYKGDWEKFDEHCFRKNVDLKSKNIYSILKCQNLFQNYKIKNYTVHYIKYNICEYYSIEKHQDSCDITIIIYLNKEDNISDTFYVGDINIQNNWSNHKNHYDSLIMWQNPMHHGEIIGNGKRDILCIFLNLNKF